MKSVMSILTLILITSFQSHAEDVAVSQTFSPVTFFSKTGAYGADGAYAVYTQTLTTKTLTPDPSYSKCYSAAMNSLFYGVKFTISGMATCSYSTASPTRTKVGISVTGYVCTYSTATCSN